MRAKLRDRSRCQVNYSVYNKWLVFNRYFCYRTGLFRRFFNAEYGNCYTFNSGVGKPLSGLLKSYKSGMRFGKAYNFYIVSSMRRLELCHHKHVEVPSFLFNNFHNQLLIIFLFFFHFISTLHGKHPEIWLLQSIKCLKKPFLYHVKNRILLHFCCVATDFIATWSVCILCIFLPLVIIIRSWVLRSSC